MTMNQTTMLGTYTLDGNVPVEPEIVLTNCTDTNMVGQLVSAFRGNPEVGFFLIENVNESAIDLNADFHFLKDSGNWVLANHNTLMDVLFDDAGFNPAGNEGTFSLDLAEGGWTLVTDDAPAQIAYLSPSEQLLVDLENNDIFTEADAVHVSSDPETFFIDPSVLAQGEHEILVSNFTLGHDTLELPEGLSIKDVVVDTAHDITEVILGGENSTDDIVVKLLGVNQAALPANDFSLTDDSGGDDLVSHMISSGMHSD